MIDEAIHLQLSSVRRSPRRAIRHSSRRREAKKSSPGLSLSDAPEPRPSMEMPTGAMVMPWPTCVIPSGFETVGGFAEV